MRTISYEIRYLSDSQFETRAEGKTLRIAGYAAVFNTRSADLGGFVEEVMPGCFTKTLQEADVRALWNHNADHVLGRNKAGTLRLSQDSTGLNYEVDLPDTQVARDLYESIQRGDVTQSSFGFSTIEDDFVRDGETGLLRQLREVQLFDVSPVTYPAYKDASIGVRAIERLAMKLGKDVAEVRENPASVFEERNKPVESTYADPYFDPSDIIVIRGRLNKAA